MIKKISFAGLLLSLMLGLSAIAFGQETTGSLEVTTKDPAGAVVPGVAITITSDTAAGFRRTVTTDDEGFVRVLQLAPGTYTVSSAAASGFAARTISTRVELGKATQVQVDLAAQAQGAV